MKPCEAYTAIRNAIGADARKRLIRSSFDERNFGSFMIVFEEGGEAKTVINDRGFLTLGTGASGNGNCLAFVASLHEADEKTLLRDLMI